MKFLFRKFENFCILDPHKQILFRKEINFLKEINQTKNKIYSNFYTHTHKNKNTFFKNIDYK